MTLPSVNCIAFPNVHRGTASPLERYNYRAAKYSSLKHHIHLVCIKLVKYKNHAIACLDPYTVWLVLHGLILASLYRVIQRHTFAPDTAHNYFSIDEPLSLCIARDKANLYWTNYKPVAYFFVFLYWFGFFNTFTVIDTSKCFEGVLCRPVVAHWTGDQQDGGSNLTWVLGMFHKYFASLSQESPVPIWPKLLKGT